MSSIFASIAERAGVKALPMAARVGTDDTGRPLEVRATNVMPLLGVSQESVMMMVLPFVVGVLVGQPVLFFILGLLVAKLVDAPNQQYKAVTVLKYFTCRVDVDEAAVEAMIARAQATGQQIEIGFPDSNTYWHAKVLASLITERGGLAYVARAEAFTMRLAPLAPTLVVTGKTAVDLQRLVRYARDKGYEVVGVPAVRRCGFLMLQSYHEQALSLRAGD